MGFIKKLLFILFIIFSLGTIATLYWANIFLPVKLKIIITQEAQRFLNRRVSIEKIDYKLFKGFIVENITIFDKDQAAQPFFHVDKATFNILVAFGFKNLKIIIPSLAFHEPSIQLIQKEKNVWNFSDILTAKLSPRKTSAFSLYLGKIMIEKGKIEITDNTLPEPLHETIEDINWQVKLSLRKKVQYALSAKILKHNSLVDIKGVYDLREQKLSSQGVMKNIPLAPYTNLLPLSSNFHIQKGFLTEGEFNLSLKKQNVALTTNLKAQELDFTWQDVHYQSEHLQIKDFKLLLKDNLNLQGKIDSSLTIIDIKDKQNYQGSISLNVKSFQLLNDSFNLQADLNIPTFSLAHPNNLQLAGDFSATSLNLVKKDKSFKLDGAFSLKNAKGSFNELYKLHGADITLFPLSLSFKEEVLGISGDILIDKALLFFGPANNQIAGHIVGKNTNLNIQNNILTLKTNFAFTDSLLKSSKTSLFDQQALLNLLLRYPLDGSSKATYEGGLVFSNASLENIPRFERIEKIKGNISFKQDDLTLKNIVFSSQGTAFSLNGKLKNLNNPYLDVTLQGDEVDLEKISALFPEVFKKFNAQISGTASLQSHYDGPLNTMADASLNIKAELKDAQILWPEFPDKFTSVFGTLIYTPDGLRWQNMNGLFKGRPFQIEGKMENFDKPLIETTLYSQDLTTHLKLHFLENLYKIDKLEGKFFNSTFNLKGHIKPQANTLPFLDLTSHFVLNLKDLKNIFPEWNASLEKFNPLGVITIDGALKGKLSNWRNWEADLTMKALKVFLLGYELDDILMQVNQRERYINKCDLSAKIYNANLFVNSSANLDEDNIPIKAVIQFQDLDLALLRKAGKIKNEELAGNFSLSLDVEGPMRNASQLTGKGNATISEGNIWKWEILEGLFGALLIPEFKSTVFTDAQANLIIKDKKIYLANAKLISKLVELKAEGWMDFDQNIQLKVVPLFSEIAIMKSESMKKGPTSLLTQTEGYIGISISGSLTEPKYQIATHPLKIFKKTTDVIKEGVTGILEEIF